MCLMIKKQLMCGIFIIIFPFVFYVISYADSSRGLIWMFFHQLYYQPVAGILSEPFFSRDYDLGFVVNLSGRIVTAFIYLVFFYIFRAVGRKPR